MNVSNKDTKCIIVIGGGLAGITAAITIAENGHKVLILEKEHILGGNSAKASSGINASQTNIQKNNNIHDNNTVFFTDTYKSAGKTDMSGAFLIGKMVLRSNDAIKWLEKHDIVLNDIKMLGGHTNPRTLRNKSQVHIGSYIIGKLIEKVNENPNINYATDSKVTSLIYKDEQVIGVRIGTEEILADGVIITTGGFSANKNMIAAYNHKISTYPTTNGKWATGDGLKLVNNKDINVQLTQMNQIQVHPTAFIDPTDPDNNTKILAAEMLRGVGGILLDDNGNRFCNELGKRDSIIDKMDQIGQTSFILAIPQKSYYDATKVIDYYRDKKLLKRMSIESVSDKYKISTYTLTNTIEKYNNDARKKIDAFGKTTFPHTPIDHTGEFYVGKVTPAIHYCMGGMKINKMGNVINKKGKIVKRLFAAGEVTGGLHGKNRLAGNSLLECIVYGRAVGNNCMENEKSKYTDIKSFTTYNRIVEKPKPNEMIKKFTSDEVELHNKEDDAWMIINNKVYDVTSTLKSHPGGIMTMKPYLGKDASEVFNQIHDSSMLSQVKIIGVIVH